MKADDSHVMDTERRGIPTGINVGGRQDWGGLGCLAVSALLCACCSGRTKAEIARYPAQSFANAMSTVVNMIF